MNIGGAMKRVSILGTLGVLAITLVTVAYVLNGCKMTGNKSSESSYGAGSYRMQYYSDLEIIRGLIFGYGPFLKESKTLQSQASVDQMIRFLSKKVLAEKSAPCRALPLKEKAA
jgi:hypothetical protein